jgi:protein-disulfide isomerase
LQGTPSFFVNGRFFNGIMSYEQLRQAIEEELRRSSAQAGRASR